MGIAIGNALALGRWHGMREFHHLGQNDMILCVMAGIVLIGLVVWAVQKRKRRWFKR
jgi:hypothetical protein